MCPFARACRESHVERGKCDNCGHFAPPLEFLTPFLRVVTSYQSANVKSAEKIIGSKFSSIDETLRFFSVVPKTTQYIFLQRNACNEFIPRWSFIISNFPLLMRLGYFLLK
jgi:hypothetical protein